MKCPNCDAESVKPGRKFCSLSCSTSFRNKNNRKFELITGICEICKCEITFSSNVKKRFCSRKCSSIWKKTAYKGRALTNEWLMKINAHKTRDVVVKHGIFQCEKCQKTFETNTSLRSHHSYCSTIKDDGITCEKCGRFFKHKRSITFHMIMMHCDEKALKKRKEIIEKQKNAAANRLNQRTSKAEISFLEKLKNIFGDENVIHKFKVDGIKHEFDFYVPSINTIIEFDGDFWHGNPNTQVLSPRMKKQFMIDTNFTMKALNCGFCVQRVWESESDSYPEKIRIIKDTHDRSQICENKVN